MSRAKSSEITQLGRRHTRRAVYCSKIVAELSLTCISKPLEYLVITRTHNTWILLTLLRNILLRNPTYRWGSHTKSRPYARRSTLDLAEWLHSANSRKALACILTCWCRRLKNNISFTNVNKKNQSINSIEISIEEGIIHTKKCIRYGACNSLESCSKIWS